MGRKLPPRRQCQEWVETVNLRPLGLHPPDQLAMKMRQRRRGLPMLKLTLTLSALYLSAIGLGLLLAPLQFGVGAVPADASPELIALMRLMGGPFLGIGALNWLSRNAGPSPLLRAILIANLIGFAIVAANDIWGVATGEAREIAKYFLVIHLLFAFAFAVALVAGGTRRLP